MRSSVEHSMAVAVVAAAGLLVLARLIDAGVPPKEVVSQSVESLPKKTVSQPPDSLLKKPVSELMESLPSDTIGLSKYFKELNLNNLCNSPMVDWKSFTKFEKDLNLGPCMCTVIYNMTKELQSSPLNATDLVVAKSSAMPFNNATYEMWKSLTPMSPSLKLLMDPLDDTAKFNNICYFDKVPSSYCTFLNMEVFLLKMASQKSQKIAPKQNVDVPDVKKPEISNDLPNESTKKIIDDFIAPSDVHVNESNANNAQKLEEPNIDDKEHFEENDDDEKVLEDVKYTTILPSDTYDSENDGSIPETKKSQLPILIKNEKDVFTKHQFSDTDDSHFLFYFSIMTILSMLFYLALYNKKKIIALLIEGRRSNTHRRRPNTASYSKVETDDGSTVF